MTYHRYILTWTLVLCCIQGLAAVRIVPEAADSVMRLVVSNASRYRELLRSYNAEVYTKGRTKILKQNFLMQYANRVIPVDRHTPDMVFEMLGITRFEAPNTFFHELKALNGNSIPNRQKQEEMLMFLNIDIYSRTALDNAILLPAAGNAFSYYDFRIEAENVSPSGEKTYQISFSPKHGGQKLISGYMIVADNTWVIRHIIFSGRYNFSDFILSVDFGSDVNEFNLPQTIDLSLRYNLFGNVISSSYHSRYTYTSVVRGWDELDRTPDGKSSFDLTNNYGNTDTVAVIRDTAYWLSKRDRPLTSEEAVLYAETDALPSPEDKATSSAEFVHLAEMMVSDINASYRNTYIRYYGFLNPSELGYSKTYGITYRQRLRIRKLFANRMQLMFIPDIGLASRRSEVFIRGTGVWEYSPRRLGSLTLSAGNANQSYPAGLLNTIQAATEDSIAQIQLPYFHHYYVDLRNQIELFNGFQLYTAATYNLRNPSKRIDAAALGKNVADIVNSRYNDFTVTVGASYTPRIYYRMTGGQKTYVSSAYPTFSLEFARAIPGVWNGKGNYGRIETDVHQSLKLGGLKLLNYHLSAGIYTSEKSAYFAEFRYFARNNMPNTWNDRLGGVFNLLDREWFYASDRYVQAHFMYESPFIFLQHIERHASRYVFAERLYLSQLWTPVKPSYTELGYGIGNHIFNIALFASLEKLRFTGAGVRFAFEIFR